MTAANQALKLFNVTLPVDEDPATLERILKSELEQLEALLGTETLENWKNIGAATDEAHLCVMKL
jgi:hypothetical protein